MGSKRCDKAGCEILFNLLSSRNDKGSIILTTNLTFDRWEEVFKDPMLTGAIIDRLAHRAGYVTRNKLQDGRYNRMVKIKYLKN